MKKLMTSEDERKVKELIDEGKTAVEISRELDINYNSIYYFVKKAGYNRLHKYSKEEVRYLIENYHRKTAREIANNLGIPVASIYNKARHLGLARFSKE